MRTRRNRLTFALGALFALVGWTNDAHAAETVRAGEYELTLPGGFVTKFDSECAPSGG